MKKLSYALVAIILFFNTAVFAKAPLCAQVFLTSAEVRAQLFLILKSYSLSQYETQIPNWILSWSARKILSSRTSAERQDRVLKMQTLFEMIHRLQSAGTPGTSAETLWADRAILDSSVASFLKDHGYDLPRQEWFIRKLVSHPAVKFLLAPTELPGMKDRNIDPELLANILREGPQRYETEIRNLYASTAQYQVDSYQAFRRGYKVVMTLVFALVAWNQFQNSKEEINEQKKEKFEQSLSDLDELLGALDEEMANRGLYK